MNLTIQEAKEIIEKLGVAQKQKNHVRLCPRCSNETLKNQLATNALSRYADVYVCDSCGTDEALRDAMGNVLPLNQWGCIRMLDGLEKR